MTTIQSPDHLLQHLAKKGDPSAFYTLVQPWVQQTYTQLRSTGNNHKEAMSQLVPFLKKLYRTFHDKPDDMEFALWYQSNQKKYLISRAEPAAGTSENKGIDQISESDLSHLDSQIKLLFMRNYGKVRPKRIGFLGKSLLKAIRSNFFLRWFFFVFLLCIAFIGAQVYLTLAHIQVSVSIGSKSFHQSIELPNALNQKLFRSKSTKMQPAIEPVASRPDSISTAPAAKPDTIIKTPDSKKHLHPHPESADISAEPEKPIRASKTQKHDLDTLGSDTAGTGEYSGRTIGFQNQKAKPAQDKLNSMQNSGKPRTAFPDSSLGSP